jgi:hypothetical protein
VLLPEFHAAFRQHPEQTSAVTNPAFSAALFEWDLFLRGEADKGRCPLNVALAAASKLDRLVYTDRMLEAFPEAAAFKAALPELVRRLKAGEGPFLDEDFRTRWTAPATTTSNVGWPPAQSRRGADCETVRRSANRASITASAARPSGMKHVVEHIPLSRLDAAGEFRKQAHERFKSGCRGAW